MSFFLSMTVMAAGRDERTHENGERHANGHSKHGDANGARPPVDGACAQRGDIKYGINYSGSTPDEETRWVSMHGCTKYVRGEVCISCAAMHRTWKEHGSNVCRCESNQVNEVIYLAERCMLLYLRSEPAKGVLQ